MRISLALVLVGCAGAQPAPRTAVEPPPSAGRAGAGGLRWADQTRSPWPADEGAGVVGAAAACGVADGALARVAARLAAERTTAGHGGRASSARGAVDAADPDRVVELLRAEGEPHVRPRVTFATGRAPLEDRRVLAELAQARHDETRCGVAVTRAGMAPDEELLVAVAVEARADLDPLPTRARVGQWLSFEAALHVEAESATLVILGPRGLPRTVPTSIDPASGLVRARFVLDRPGAFDVQLVGELASGPTPLLEARVFSDVDPPDSASGALPQAPGEDAASDAGDTNDADALARMTSALRASEGLSQLARDRRLDALALAQAIRMRDAAVVAHDTGEGDLVERASAAGLTASILGENLAHARSVALAYRALHASPSHRMNLLRADYTHIGLAVVPSGPDASGAVYVAQVFARRPR